MSADQRRKRLTRTQVAQLLAEGATERQDLERAFVDADVGLRPVRVYELGQGRVLQVFNEAEPGLGGKGDILTLDYFERFLQGANRARVNAKAGRNNAASHWWYHSRLRAALPEQVPPLMAELASRLGGIGALEMTYAGLDAASRHIDAIGFERAQLEIYDHLVVYVGEVVRMRTRGEWRVETSSVWEPHPYVSAPKHAPIMPVNVVWSQLIGIDPPDLRREAANEVRRARANYLDGSSTS